MIQDIPPFGRNDPGTEPAYASLNTYPPNQFQNVPPDPKDPMKPYTAIKSINPVTQPTQPVTIDATECKDLEGKPVANYQIDFGDGTMPVRTTKPITKHVYSQPGTYPVTITAIDKYGNKGTASLTQVVKDPRNPMKRGPPHAELASNPKETKPQQPVQFDASKSCDYEKKPCKSFLWDFGDNTPKQTTSGPRTTHKYASEGTYPVTVTVTDKYNQTAQASVTQRYTP